MDAVTFKQLEALYWAAELGSFKAASLHLNTTQSAVAKRIRELEASLGVQLFNRSRKTIMLTPRGEEVLAIASELIQLRGRLGEVVSGGYAEQRVARIGVTDLTAMTWLGTWLKLMREQDPELEVLPQVDLSARLFDDLIDEKLDIAIVPDAFSDPRFEKVVLSDVPNAWVTSQSYIAEDFLPLHELVEHTVITQTNASGAGRIFSGWLGRNQLTLAAPMHTSNFGAMLSLAVSGFGVAFLPRDCLRDVVDSGRVKYLGCDKALPPVRYVALFRRLHVGGRLSLLTDTMKEACDFSRPLLSLPDTQPPTPFL